MELSEKQNEIEDLLQQIKSSLITMRQIAEKSLDDYIEKDYEELEQIVGICKDILSQISKIEEKEKRNEIIIYKVERAKKIAPLVPVEDIIEGLTEEKFEELKREHKEFGDLLNSEEYKEFRKLDRELKWQNTHGVERKKREEEIKNILTNPEPAKGAKAYCYEGSIDGGSPRYTSEKIKILYEKYNIIPAFYHSVDIKYEGTDDIRENGYYKTITVTRSRSSKPSFKSYKDCELEEKQCCKEFEEKIKKILESENQEYDKPGKVLGIDITQRELARAGILSEDLGWESLEQIKEEQLQAEKEKEAKVSPKDIADADREQALTTTEIAGFKGFIKKLLDRFKGKGEK